MPEAIGERVRAFVKIRAACPLSSEAWIQLTAAVWGVLVEWSGSVCPLTPLENWLRAHGGAAGYAGGFVEQYLLPVLYPARLTRGVQILLGAAVLAANLIAYALVLA